MQHNGLIPKSPAEKDLFKASVKALSRDYSKELNFSEAMTQVFKCFLDPAKLRDSVQEVLGDPKIHSTQEKSKYWLMAAALARFFKEFKALPLSGKLPDMTATTEFYINL